MGERLTRWELAVPDESVCADQLSVLLGPVDQEIGIAHGVDAADVC